MFDVCIIQEACIFSEEMNITKVLCAEVSGVAYHEKWNVLCLRGYINEENYKDLFSIHLMDNVQVDMQSVGGELPTAIRITEHLENYDYDIHVNGVCASACAQFIFLGASEKYIYRDGAVVMHGGPMARHQYQEGRTPEQVQSIDRQMDEFRKFYEVRGINIDLTRTPPADVAKQLSEGKVVFWQPSIEQFIEYGVGRIHYDIYHPNVSVHLKNIQDQGRKDASSPD